MRYYRALDTFTADLKNGGQMRVVKGDVKPESDELVQLDAGRGVLFSPLDDGEDEQPKPRRTSRAKQAAGDDTGGKS